MPPMRTTLLMLALGTALMACGGDDEKTVDAAPPIDAAIDAPPLLAQNCATYCTEISTACTAANQQYNPALMNCAATCAKFAMGTGTDMAGDTLGCRLWHIQNITVRAQPAATHCAHAGPAGAALAAATGVCGANACANFCKLQVSVCGTAQYASEAECNTMCAGFAKTPEYNAATTSGNTLACRVYHITNAAVSAAAATTHCPHTGPTPAAACI